MENNTKQNTQAENMGDGTDAQEKEGAQKTFTQEEVDAFIQEKVEETKKQTETEYSQKVAEVEARERKLMVREGLQERGMPKELADIISCTDEADLKAKLDILQKYASKSQQKEEEKPVTRVGFFPLKTNTSAPDQIRKAMGLE